MTMIEQLTAVAIAELERQRGDGPFFYLDANDPSCALIDGNVDLPALVRAIVKAMREPGKSVIRAVGYDREIPTIWRAMIDDILDEETSPPA